MLLQKRSTLLPLLHCVDNMAHAHTTADLVAQTAAKLALKEHLRLHVADAWTFELLAQADAGGPDLKTDRIDDVDEIEADDQQQLFDMIWIDFGAADKIGEFFDRCWPKVMKGVTMFSHVHLAATVCCNVIQE